MTKTVLFWAIQFSISSQFILFDPLIGPYQVPPLWARIKLEAMEIKIPQTSEITGLSPSDYSYQYTHKGSLIPLQSSSRCILQPQPTEPVAINI